MPPPRLPVAFVYANSIKQLWPTCPILNCGLTTTAWVRTPSLWIPRAGFEAQLGTSFRHSLVPSLLVDSWGSLIPTNVVSQECQSLRLGTRGHLDRQTDHSREALNLQSSNSSSSQVAAFLQPANQHVETARKSQSHQWGTAWKKKSGCWKPAHTNFRQKTTSTRVRVSREKEDQSISFAKSVREMCPSRALASSVISHTTRSATTCTRTSRHFARGAK